MNGVSARHAHAGRSRRSSVSMVLPVLQRRLANSLLKRADKPRHVGKSHLGGNLAYARLAVQQDNARAPGSSLGLASQVMFWLDEHYQEKFRLDALAETLGKSRSYVSRKFHAETGEKIHDYLNTLRLRKACERLLHSEASVREIATQGTVLLCLEMIILSVASTEPQRTIKSMKRINEFHRGLKPGKKSG